MSDTKSSSTQGLSAEQANEVGGAGFLCEADELRQLLNGLKDNYETLVDTMSHVIERVAGK